VHKACTNSASEETQMGQNMTVCLLRFVAVVYVMAAVVVVALVVVVVVSC
jgi:hypothetical protein